MIVIILTIIGILMMIILKIVQCIRKRKSAKKYNQIDRSKPQGGKEDVLGGDIMIKGKDQEKKPLNVVAPKQSATPLMDDDDDFLAGGQLPKKPQINEDEFQDDFLAGNNGDDNEIKDEAF